LKGLIMKQRTLKWAIGVGATLTLGLGAIAVYAQSGHMGAGMGAMQGGQHPHEMMHGTGRGMGHGAGGHGAGGQGAMSGPTGMLTKQDAGSAADMNLVHDLVTSHASIKRTVKNLPNGVSTITESDDPKIAQAIKAHVASMSARLNDGREFNIFSKTLPVLFENADKITSKVEMTEKGTVVTRTSGDAKVVAALQGHAGEVSELVQDGPAAMQRGMMSRMAMGSQGNRGQAAPQHRH